MAMAVADHTGQAWFQGFNDVGKVIFNMTADELIELKVSDRARLVDGLRLMLCYRRTVMRAHSIGSLRVSSEACTTLLAERRWRHSWSVLTLL